MSVVVHFLSHDEGSPLRVVGSLEYFWGTFFYVKLAFCSTSASHWEELATV